MVFLFIFVIVNALIVFGKLYIEIENFNIDYKKNIHINDDYKITIKLIILKKIQLLKKEYNKNKISKIKKKTNIKNKIKKFKNSRLTKTLNKKKEIKIVKIFILKMFEMIKIDLKIKIGTKDAATTAILSGLVSTIISNFLRIKIKNIETANYKIIPIYNNQNKIIINFTGIFVIKLRHIINIIYILIKEKGDNKYERTSDREPYDYSYE